MFRHILVPLDGSPRAEETLPVAARLACATGAMLTLLRVVTPLLEADLNPVKLSRHIDPPLDAYIASTRDYLMQVVSTGDLEGIDIRKEVLTGAAAQSILLYARLQHVDLIVIASRGMTGSRRWHLGSVSQPVAHHSPVPVLLLHEGGPHLVAWPADAPRSLRLLVALDGSHLAESALLPAAWLCAALSAPAQGALRLVRVLRELPGKEGRHDASITEPAIRDARAYLRGVTRRLAEGEAAGLNLTITSSVVVQPDIADTLIRIAERGEFIEDDAGGGFDAIAMATHGYNAFGWWEMGSITERVLSGTKLPLLIVRPPETATPTADKPVQDEGIAG